MAEKKNSDHTTRKTPVKKSIIEKRDSGDRGPSNDYSKDSGSRKTEIGRRRPPPEPSESDD